MEDRAHAAALGSCSHSAKLTEHAPGAKASCAPHATSSRRKPDNKELGNRGEDIACRYLADNNASILERNWKCSAGEADIIARENDDLVFIEVKTRSSIARGFPEDAVTAQKRGKYERIALHYLATHEQPSSRVRFDVIAVVLIGTQQVFLKHYRDAFGTQ
jgi:putative endonuclease